MKESDLRVPKMILAHPAETPMSAIIVYGGSNCGKTSTLQHLIVLLCGGGKKVLAIQKAFENVFYYSKKDCYSDADVIIPYQTKNGIIPIYVSTDGDSWSIVEDNFRFFYHCVRSKHKVYVFKNNTFIQCNNSDLERIARPLICITPANIVKSGGLQAAHYYLDLTCEDWRRNYWFRKDQNEERGKPVKGYNRPRNKRIYDVDAKVAKRIVKLIDQMLVEKVI